MQTFTNRDGLSIAWQLDSFAAPWSTPDTVLLLHAAMGSSQRWFRWMPRLASRYRVLRMDLRGHGLSQIPPPDQAFSLAHLVGDVLELLDREAPGAVHVVGNSAGGYVAQRLAIEHPGRVRRLRSMAPRRGSSKAMRPPGFPKSRNAACAGFWRKRLTSVSTGGLILHWWSGSLVRRDRMTPHSLRASSPICARMIFSMTWWRFAHPR